MISGGDDGGIGEGMRTEKRNVGFDVTESVAFYVFFCLIDKK